MIGHAPKIRMMKEHGRRSFRLWRGGLTAYPFAVLIRPLLVAVVGLFYLIFSEEGGGRHINSFSTTARASCVRRLVDHRARPALDEVHM